jgi:transcriptional regulator GlxA family with amidase domain
MSVQIKITASVCTSSSLLGKAGLLDGRESTTHFQAFDFLRQAAPNTKNCEDVLFTLTEPTFTSAGVSAGIDLALRIVAHFFGEEVGIATARYMGYPSHKAIRGDSSSLIKSISLFLECE